MAYSTSTGHVLISMGYESDTDFIASRSGGIITLEWFHTDPKPSEQDITDIINDVTPLPNGKTYTQSQEPAHVEIGGIKYDTSEASQNALTRMMTLVTQSGMASTDEVAVKDCLGVSHTLTVEEFTADLIQFGLYCYNEFHA
jgi:hypothetical protein